MINGFSITTNYRPPPPQRPDIRSPSTPPKAFRAIARFLSTGGLSLIFESRPPFPEPPEGRIPGGP
jgi:hypothetical protein